MITLVTGLWDIGRGELNDGWSRSYTHYLDKFSELLKMDSKMIIFGDSELKEFVFSVRDESNTQFILRDLSWFKTNEYFDLIQNIRNNPKWYNQVGWLKDSTQSRLEMYNPLVMSKMFLLNDAKILDKFNSEKLYWIDAGLTNTVHSGYFTHDNVLEKINIITDKFLFVSFPYDAELEIHGFDYNEMKQLTNSIPNVVARGGFFGGNKDTISQMNTLYYGLLIDTLKRGFMGTEESLFTILLYQYPKLIDYCQIESNGLVYKFFEDVKNNKVVLKNEGKKVVTNYNGDVGTQPTFQQHQGIENYVMSIIFYI